MRLKLPFVLLGTACIAIAILISIAMHYTRPSTQANPEVVVDYCAHSISSEIRAITSGVCRREEWSLGSLPIKRSEFRPESLDPQLLFRFLAAQMAARELGHELAITSGYRSMEYQEFLFQSAVERHGSIADASKWVLPAEESNHPWGLAIDINYGVGGTKGKKAAAWLEKNGYKYGLCRRYENEWWHFEPLVAPGQSCPVMEPYAS
jgi:D-alanyl-D-alanine dipeptidase